MSSWLILSISNLICRYDKGVRGYVHVLEGDSITTRIHLPASDRTARELLSNIRVLGFFCHPIRLDTIHTNVLRTVHVQWVSSSRSSYCKQLSREMLDLQWSLCKSLLIRYLSFLKCILHAF